MFCCDIVMEENMDVGLKKFLFYLMKQVIYFLGQLVGKASKKGKN